jgi:hypothetical protein
MGRMIRVERRELSPLMTGGGGGGDRSAYGLHLEEHERVLSITEHPRYPMGGGGGWQPPTFTYSAWVVVVPSHEDVGGQ